MGEVVRFKRSVDDDLSMHFQEACSAVPEELDQKIQEAATRALGASVSAEYRPSFKTVCIVVSGACLIGALLARGVSNHWNDAVDLSAANQTDVLNTGSSPQLAGALPAPSSENSWRRTRGAWAEYISRLESDPYYRYVLQEKRRFEASYPSGLRDESH